MAHSAAISRADLFQYGVLALPLAYCGLPLYIHAPDFYVTQFGVSLSALAAVLLLIRIFDAVQDPVIGMLLDKYSRHRRLIAIVSGFVLGLGFIALYVPMGMQSVGWFAVHMTLATTAFSILSIHLNAQGSLWSDSQTDKALITGWREALGLVGLLMATILPTILMQFLPADTTYSLYACLFGLVLVFSLLCYLRWDKKYPKLQAPQKVFINSQEVWGLIKNDTDMVRFYSTYALSVLASSFPAVLLIFFVRDRLGAENYTGAFLLAYFLSAIVSMPFWKRVADYAGKQKAWLYAMGSSIVIFGWAFFLDSGDIWPYALICVLSGWSLGAELSLPPALLSDVIDKKGKSAATSTLFAMMAFCTKMTLAVATSFAFFALDISGFKPASLNSEQSLVVLSGLYALLPCGMKAVACLILIFWIGKERTNYDTRKTIDSLRSGHDA